MAYVYVIRGAKGRHYIGATENLERRFSEHQSGSNHTTKRLGAPVELIASREFPSMTEARAFERQLKRWKNPRFAILQCKAPDESSPE